MQFQIVKGEPYERFSSWYNRIITMTPVFWIGADGVKHFISILSSNTGSDFDEKNEKEELDRKVELLRNNDGKYIPVYLKDNLRCYPVEDIDAFLKWKRENGYTFDKRMTDPVRWNKSENSFNFLGNLCEYSAAFWFRIYDKDLADKCIAALDEDGITEQ